MNRNLEDVLNEAVSAQFIHLFSVLVKEVTAPEQALERFKNGLHHLAEVEAAVAKMIRDKEA